MASSFFIRFLVFLVLNFAALGLGSYFTGSGVSSDWYQTLNKAPWTPPGWVFGVAWTTIMIAFSFYMAWLYERVPNPGYFWGFYAMQWILNVSWNPAFFALHATEIALLLIVGLTLTLLYAFFRWWSSTLIHNLALAPYVIWLFIATSLNAFIVWNNP